ncbi:uncharacterized protein F5891DRAFT_564311 [Suillus fuscotomentosus]|uniref:Transmembrane protein n=1 Tax=Suillus fuscotomentosus TaxID=1912939 RepID=A0AAD4HI58_9AGAM|nr:uncharacterized protein F5891DRAFT_564311 [Suillus fuscotomentosus]KAG1897056.1 hypothetical protein F5891DRAFT_564311 [Suillus fuscotomentosus]
MRSLVLFCIFLYLVGVIQAAPTTNTTTSTSSGIPEVPSFTNRTLWHILSSCVLAIFACIYSAIHPNIPSPKDSSVLILWRRLGTMIMALITPEVIVLWAMRQWFSTRYVTKQFEESGYFGVPPPQEQPGDYGSIQATAEQYVEDRDSTRLLIAHPEAPTSIYGGTHALARPFKYLFKTYVSEQSEDYSWTQTHSFFVLMGGFMLYVDGKPYLTLQPDDILKLICKGFIDAPTLMAKQIEDRSKGNAISKGLIILQVGWFVMQLITRAIYHLEITQLEVGTLAFAVLNFLVYAVWWNKPLNVQCPYPVYWKSTESRPEDYINDAVEEKEPTGLKEFLDLGIFPILELMGASTSQKLQVPTFDGSIKFDNLDMTVLMLSALLIATIFGGVHCIAWFLSFPTYQEQVLWRTSAVVTTCTPSVSLCFLCIAGIFVKSESHAFRIIAVLLFAISSIMYVTGRGVLLILMFTTLRNLPPDVYKVVSWTALVPHL